MKRLTLCLLIMLLCVLNVFPQTRRNRQPAAPRMTPGYYFTIGMCTGCVYPDWHDHAIRMFRARGIRAVVGRGYETQTSSQPFAPLRSFEMRFDTSNVDRDSQILAQIALYVGSFATEEAAIRALAQFPSVLRGIIQRGGLTNFSVSSQVTRSSGNQFSSGSSSPFFISGYRLLPSAITPRGASQQQDWNSFWNAFRAAVQRRDRRALRAVMTRDFGYTFGAYPPGDRRATFFRYLDEQRGAMWRVLDRVIARGSQPYTDTFYTQGRPSMVSRDG